MAYEKIPVYIYITGLDFIPYISPKQPGFCSLLRRLFVECFVVNCSFLICSKWTKTNTQNRHIMFLQEMQFIYNFGDSL